MNQLEQGCIDIWIDEIVPCLKNVETGEIKETVVFKIESRAYLKKFQEKDGWHINWNEIPKDVEVYALALKHYIENFHAEYLGMLHQYQFFIDEENAKELLEVYHYEWNEA